jgi:hypothetical protein
VVIAKSSPQSCDLTVLADPALRHPFCHGLSNERRRFNTVNCCHSTKFSKMKSRRLRKIRRSDPNASQRRLSLLRFITRVLASGPLLCY